MYALPGDSAAIPSRKRSDRLTIPEMEGPMYVWKDKQKSDYRTLDATRRRFRNEVLQEADVICSTLSASSYEYLESFEFEVVIIDEAAQAIELSTLIPLKFDCKHVVMVGGMRPL